MLNNADQVGVDRKQCADALSEVHWLPSKPFEKVVELLKAFVNELSEKASAQLLFEKQQAELKRTQHLLRSGEQRFSGLFDTVPVGYQSLDVNGNIIDVNFDWLRLLGYNRAAVTGKWFGEYVSPEFQLQFRNYFSALKANGESHCEVQLVKKNG